jgi:hypothetical protein
MLRVVTLEEFVDEIDKIMTLDGCSLIEAVVSYAETHDADFDSLVPYINASFKDSIRSEAETRNMMKRNETQLPL